MSNCLILYINRHGLLYECQFGFQKGKSTHMALIALTDEITESMGQGEFVIVILLDFSKPFETADHGILLQKLQLYMVYKLLLWNSLIVVHLIVCNMQHIRMLSRIKKMWNAEYHLDEFWALTLLLYINNLTTVMTTSVCVLFADDTNIFLWSKNIQLCLWQ